MYLNAEITWMNNGQTDLPKKPLGLEGRTKPCSVAGRGKIGLAKV